MTDTSLTEDEVEPLSIVTHSKVNILKDTWDDFDNLSHTSFGSNSSEDKISNTTGKCYYLNKEVKPLYYNGDKKRYEVEPQICTFINNNIKNK